MAGYWPRSFFVFMDQDGVEVLKKELGRYPAILTSHSVNNPYFPNIAAKVKRSLFCRWMSEKHAFTTCLLAIGLHLNKDISTLNSSANY